MTVFSQVLGVATVAADVVGSSLNEFVVCVCRCDDLQLLAWLLSQHHCVCCIAVDRLAFLYCCLVAWWLLCLLFLLASVVKLHMCGGVAAWSVFYCD